MFEEIKKLIKHSLVYACGTIMSRAVGFLMIPVYTRYLTTEDYGIIELFDVITGMLSLLIIAGVGISVFKFYFDYDENERKKVVSTALIFNLTCSILLALILIQFSDAMSSIFFGHLSYGHFFKIIFITFITEVSLSVPVVYLMAERRSIFFTGFAIFRLIIGLSFNIYFVVVLKMGVIGVLYSALISGGIGCIILIPLTVKNVGIGFSFNKLKKILVYGLPIIPSNLCTFTLSFANRFFLRYFSGLQDLGLFSLGSKFAMVLHILITSPFLLSWTGFMFSTGKKENAQQIFSRILIYFSFLSIFVGLEISILTKDVLKIIATPSFFDAYKVVALLILGYIFFGINYIFQTGIYLKSKTKWFPFIEGIGAIINLFLNWVLVPRYGMLGAAGATSTAYLLKAVITYFVSNYYYDIPYQFNRILKMLFLAILIYFSGEMISITSIFYSILLKGMMVLAFPILLVFVNFYHKDEKDKIREVARGVYYKIWRKQVNAS